MTVEYIVFEKQSMQVSFIIHTLDAERESLLSNFRLEAAFKHCKWRILIKPKPPKF
jgi:hypothetical protein